MINTIEKDIMKKKKMFLEKIKKYLIIGKNNQNSFVLSLKKKKKALINGYLK
jgi:hypothetical protein